MARYGAGMSAARDGATAARDAVAGAIDAAGGAPVEAVVLLATVAHADPRPLVAAGRDVAGGAVVVGCSVSGVLTGAGEIEEGPGVAALAIAGDGELPAPRAFLTPASEGPFPAAASGPALALLFADGYSAHPERVAGAAAGSWGDDVTLVGGLAAAGGAQRAFRWRDDEIAAAGACGLLVAARSRPVVAVAQGCCPVGPAFTVTAATGSVIEELDGRPAFTMFAERARPLLPDLARAAQVVFLAVPVTPDSASDPVADDYLVRGFLRFDPERGLLAMSEPVPVGTRVRFAVREPQSARASLRRALAQARRALAGVAPRLGVYLCCAGRGRSLFGVSDHDVAFIQGELGSFPLIGMFCGGELAPVSGRARLHLFSGVLALVT